MANALYDSGREAFLKGEISWNSDNIKVVLVDSGYSENLASHQFLSDISVGDRVATSPNLTGKSTTAGVADAADVTFSAVSGSPIVAMVIYKDTGSAATSPLIAFIDTATGLSLTPNGSDIEVQWDNGANKIFRL